jgi:hypothetical protein
VRIRGRVAVVALAAAALLSAAGAQAIPMGAYGNTARFDQLTGQRTQSGLVFLGWDQGLTVIWNPLAVGVPDVAGNHFSAYFPGSRYVDAYGNNYYNTTGVYAFHRTEGLYKAYPRKPFMFPEWGMTVDDSAYVKAFATFIRRHRRVRFVSFFNGPAGGPYDLGTKPRSRAAYRRFITPLSR